MFYSNKFYISYELSCFGVQNWFIIKDLLIYIKTYNFMIIIKYEIFE
jgi:hypothetical protein